MHIGPAASTPTETISPQLRLRRVIKTTPNCVRTCGVCACVPQRYPIHTHTLANRSESNRNDIFSQHVPAAVVHKFAGQVFGYDYINRTENVVQPLTVTTTSPPHHAHTHARTNHTYVRAHERTRQPHTRAHPATHADVKLSAADLIRTARANSRAGICPKICGPHMANFGDVSVCVCEHMESDIYARTHIYTHARTHFGAAYRR